MQRNILIISIDQGVLGEAAKALDEEAFSCARAGNLPEALERIQGERFDLAVLDAATVGVEDVSQVTLLRAKGHLPILAIAPRGDAQCASSLLSAGATDYLTSPFEARELRERVEVQLLRGDGVQSSHALRYRDLTLDPDNFNVTILRHPLALTRQEFKILELMLSFPPGRIFSKQDFFEYAWDSNYAVVDKTVNVHICNIRKKLKAVTDDEYIETIWGFGFRLA